jgi:hypothetical protein
MIANPVTTLQNVVTPVVTPVVTGKSLFESIKRGNVTTVTTKIKIFLMDGHERIFPVRRSIKKNMRAFCFPYRHAVFSGDARLVVTDPKNSRKHHLFLSPLASHIASPPANICRKVVTGHIHFSSLAPLRSSQGIRRPVERKPRDDDR